MVAVDTNIVVRFLTRDHESQYRKAYRLFAKSEIFIPDTVILETEWVLRYAYGFQAKSICDAFERLFGLENVHIANPHSTAQAIEWHRDGLDFSDALHLASSQECDGLYSFDARFIKKAKGRSKCSVARP
ncbi:MAG TPA: type II toxin-antitoxin system VapC family toxin [Rhodothermales bacterium]|nr:type II toxin-antitoxin system VapC family toxin [Rhodothermales bacterium]